MVILLDVDSVITDLLGKMSELFEREFGAKLSPSMVTSWHAEDWAAPDHMHFFKNLWNRQGLFGKLEPLPGAIKGVRTLVSEGHDVHLVTAVSMLHYADRAAWVQEYLPFVKSLCMTEDKHLVWGHVFIDDSPANLLSYRAAHPEAKIGTINYPYNREAHHVCDFVASLENPWDEICAWVSSLKPIS